MRLRHLRLAVPRSPARCCISFCETHTRTRVRVCLGIPLIWHCSNGNCNETAEAEVCQDSKMRSRRIGPCICIPNNAWPWECARDQHGSPWRTKRVIFNPVIRFCTGLHRTSRERSREDCQVPNEVTRSRGDRQRHAWDLRFYGKARQLDRPSKHAHLKPALGASITISREREREREKERERPSQKVAFAIFLARTWLIDEVRAFIILSISRNAVW